jgi:CubicO group peptidase (beta-lactamase class C family)
MKYNFSRATIALLLLVIPVALISAKPEGTPAAAPEIDAALKPFVENHSLAGAVTLVADKDKVISVNAVGFLDVGAKMRMIVDAIFWIASMSKPITAVGLMMLVDEGKVSLDDPVEKYLPEFKQVMVMGPDKTLKKPASKITVRQLLTHTSGMNFSTPKEVPTLDVLTLKEGAQSYAETPLHSEPGTKHQYSNAGINTAGRIIEVVSGMPYEDFMDKRLFIPLGMKDTTFWPSEEQVKRLAKAYRPTKDKMNLEEMKIGQLKYPLSDRKRQPMPAGGLFSTAHDVARFCQMVANNGEFQGKRYLSEAAVQQMKIRQTGDKVKQSWGLGFSLGGEGSFGHGGALSTNMNIDTKTGMITVFLVQHQGFPGNGNQSQTAFRNAAAVVFKNSVK